MDSPLVRVVIAVLFGIGAIGFLSALFVRPPWHKQLSPGLSVAMRALSCVIGCGYLVAAYVEFHAEHPLNAVTLIIVVCAFLNLIVLGVERPWSRRATTQTLE